MRIALLAAVVAVGALACGKKGDQNQSTQNPPAPAAAATDSGAAPAGGQVVEVKMTGNGSTRAAFEPSSITITPGTTVRFTNVSGGPHNIAFWSDSVPSGAAAALQQGMKNTIDNLSGPFLTQPNDTYDVTFPANAPKGNYKGYCVPHVTMGMKLAIKVQ
jgi:plastocyanin